MSVQPTLSASDSEFEQYSHELNDILVETYPTDCPI